MESFRTKVVVSIFVPTNVSNVKVPVLNSEQFFSLEIQEIEAKDTKINVQLNTFMNDAKF